MEVEVYYFLVVLLFIVVHTIHGQSARDMIMLKNCPMDSLYFEKKGFFVLFKLPKNKLPK